MADLIPVDFTTKSSGRKIHYLQHTDLLIDKLAPYFFAFPSQLHE
jgi:hypothetical protein